MARSGAKRRSRTGGASEVVQAAPSSAAPVREPVPSTTADDSARMRVVYAAVATIAIVIRLAYVVTARGPAFSDPLVDADYYDYLGERIADGHGFDPGAFWQPPLYPAVLGVIYRIAGHSLWAPRLVQVLLGAATAVGVAVLARRASGARASAWIAGLFVAFHGVLVFYDGEILATSLALALATFAVVLATRETTRDAVGGGVLIGLATLAVAPCGLVAPSIAAVMWRRDRRAALSLLAAFALVVGACAVTNRVRSGEWVLVSANSGVNLWLGNNPDGDAALAIRPGAAWEALMEEPAAAGAHTAASQDRWFRDRALGFCASHPIACASGIVHKARLLVSSREMPRNEDVYRLRAQSPVLAALVWHVRWIGFPGVILFPLAAVGAALLARSRAEDDATRTKTRHMVLVALLALCAGPVLFFVTGRHRVPVIPLACVAAAVACVEVARAIRHGAKIDTGLAVAMALGMLVFAVSAWPTRYATDGVNFDAEMYFEVAGRRARRGDHQGAIDALHDALARRPDYREAAVNLALEFVHAGRTDAAIATLDEMLQYYPEDSAMRAERDLLRGNNGAAP